MTNAFDKGTEEKKVVSTCSLVLKDNLEIYTIKTDVMIFNVLKVIELLR